MLQNGLLPHFLPTTVADGIAQCEHGIDILALEVAFLPL
jgi:hypothetical protein